MASARAHDDELLIPGYRLRERLRKGWRWDLWRATCEHDTDEVGSGTPRSSSSKPRSSEPHSSEPRSVLLRVSTSPMAPERLRPEFDLAARVGHPRLVRYLRVESERGHPAAVLEDPGGRLLPSCVAEGPLDLPSLLRLGIDVAHALTAIHDARWVHNAVAPRNVFFADGRATLGDLGSASRSGWISEGAGMRAGALAFAAPEQTGRIRRPLDPRADLYGVGATLYFAATGRPPFAGETVEVLHGVLAADLEPADHLRPSLPAVVSRLISVLLAKAPEDRYASTRHLLRDLEHCLRSLEEDGAIRDFDLSLSAPHPEVRMPGRIYGREEILEELHATADWPSATLVVGDAGSGKSSLVRAIVERAHAEGRAVVEGRFVPGAVGAEGGVLGALDDHLRGLLALPDETLEEERSRLRSALGTSLPMAVEVLPRLGQIFAGTDTPPADDLADGGAQERVAWIASQLLGLLAEDREGPPVLLVLDDLHLADAPARALLRDLHSSRRVGELAILATARPRAETTDSLVRSIGMSVVELPPIGGPALIEMVEDTLGCPTLEATSIVDMILPFSTANPAAFRRALLWLTDQNLLRYDLATESWTWDEAEFRARVDPKGFRAMIRDRVGSMPAPTQDALRLASCLRGPAPLDTLATVLGVDPDGLASALRSAVEGDLVELEEVWPVRFAGARAERWVRFLQRDVQVSIYEALPVEEAAPRHAKLARALFDDPRVRVAERARQLYIARAELSRDELGRLAGWSIELAQSAARVGDHQAACARAREAVDIIFGARARLESEDTPFRALEVLAHAELLAGDFERANAAVDRATEHANTKEQLARLAVLRLESLTSSGRWTEAVETGLGALRELEFPDVDEGGASLARVLDAIERSGGLEALGRLPVLENEPARAALRLVNHLISPVYVARPDLLPGLTAAGVAACLDHGITGDAAYVFSSLGLVMHASGRMAEAEALGRFALELLQRHPSPSLGHKVRASVAGCLLPWYAPIPESYPLERAAMRDALAAGDGLYAGFAAIFESLLLYSEGAPLERIRSTIASHAAFVERTQNPSRSLDILLSRLVLNLTGELPSRLSLDDGEFSAEAFDRELEESKFAHGRHLLTVVQMHITLLRGEPAQAVRLAEAGRVHHAGAVGQLSLSDFELFEGIARGAVHQGLEGEPRARNLVELEARHAQMCVWRDACPSRFEHRVLALDAELAWARDDPWPALGLYERAISAAHAAGSLSDEALFSLRAAALVDPDETRARGAASFLANARDRLRQWGATDLVAILEQRHPELRRRSSTPSHGLGPEIDRAALLKAGEAVAAGGDARTIASRLAEILAKSTGAQHVVLAMPERGRLSAFASYGDPAPGAPLPFPPTIARYAARTAEALASGTPLAVPFENEDPYLAAVRPSSYLALPFRRANGTSGVAYIEHRSVRDAFGIRPDEGLTALIGQVAASLDAALTRDELVAQIDERERAERELALARARLEDLVEVRTNELRRAQDEAVANARLALLGQLAATVSHELRNPLGAIRLSAIAVQHQTPRGTSQARALDRIARNVDRCDHIIRQLLDFATDATVARGPTRVNEWLRTVLAMEWPPGIELRLELPEEDTIASIDRESAERALRYLIWNALEAMGVEREAAEREGEGTLTVRSQTFEDRVVIEFVDTGEGIPDDVWPRIFEPLFSTKSYGAGLGLAIARRTMRAHGGDVEVERLPRGTAARASFPLS